MPGHTPVFGAVGAYTPTYEVSGNVIGGKLVAIDGSTGKIKQNVTANAAVLGVAATDGQAASDSDTSTDAWGNANVNASLHPSVIAVWAEGVHALLNSGAALVWGDYVKADNAGGVTKAIITTPGTDYVIGRVMNTAGAATGAKAEIWLSLTPSGPTVL